jgi:hypothetical protein
LDIDTCFSEPPEMFFPQLGVNEMERFIPPVETIFDERAKHSMLLIGAIEESTNMMLPGEISSGKPRELILGCHISPHMHTRHINY